MLASSRGGGIFFTTPTEGYLFDHRKMIISGTPSPGRTFWDFPKLVLLRSINYAQ